MSYKTILVCLATEQAAEQILPASCRLVRAFGAHMIGIHTLEALVLYPGIFLPGIALYYDDPRFTDFNREVREQDARIQDIFEAHTANKGFIAEWRSLLAHSEHASDQLIRSAFFCDLVVVARPDRESERSHQIGAQHDLIMNSGRPVLLIPPDYGDKLIGSPVLLAWNATREAAVAARAALPFFSRAEETFVLTIASEQRHSISDILEGHEVAKMLGRHGVEPDVIHTGQTEDSIGAQILREAKNRNCDLIVMGAFGHSRLHSFFFGDATQFMLENADVPILYCN